MYFLSDAAVENIDNRAEEKSQDTLWWKAAPAITAMVRMEGASWSCPLHCRRVRQAGFTDNVKAIYFHAVTGERWV